MSNFTVLNPTTPGAPNSAPGIWSASTPDSLNTITAAGYLDDRYLDGEGEMNEGDILYINYDIEGTATITAGVATLSAGHLNFVEGLPGSGGGSGGVTSVFTRTGAVTAQSGDYTVAQVTGAAPLASPTFTGTIALNGALRSTNAPNMAVGSFTLPGDGSFEYQVNNTIVTANSLIFLSNINNQSGTGAPGICAVLTIDPGNSFTVLYKDANDTSTYAYLIIN